MSRPTIREAPSSPLAAGRGVVTLAETWWAVRLLNAGPMGFDAWAGDGDVVWRSTRNRATYASRHSALEVASYWRKRGYPFVLVRITRKVVAT